MRSQSRAVAWQHAFHTTVCDSLEPWAHGTVARATGYPSYWDYNVVRVEEDARMSVEELASFADLALAGLAHRRVDFDNVADGEPLRAGFEAAGWQSLRLLWMHHEVPAPHVPEIAVQEVPYDAVYELRIAWHQENSPGVDPGDYHEHARGVALNRGAQVLAVMEGPTPIAFAQLEREGTGAEITQVYVHPDCRGGGYGTAMTAAAITAAAGAADLWICADDEDRPKALYRRLGFRPAHTTMEFLLHPTMKTDEAQIRALVKAWAKAAHEGDLETLLADHAEDIVMFDVPPPDDGVRGIDAYREVWPGFFEWQEGASFEIVSLEVTAGEDVAYAFALLRCGTPKELAENPARRLRLTLGLRRENDRWVVAHEHHSFPFT